MRRRQRGPCLAVAAVCVVWSVLATGLSVAATGAFSVAGCFADASGSTGCTADAHNELTGAQGVAVSPDGKSVYLAATNADALARFDRAPNGTLTPKGCFENTSANGCAQIAGTSLDGANRVVVSPDGKDVYVTAYGAGAINHFTRSASGALTFADCIASSFTSGCTHPATGSMNTPDGIDISPDGKSVYIVGSGNGVMTLARAASGVLTETGCIEDNGLDGCTAPAHDSMFFPKDVTVSPDGQNVYVVAQYGGSITEFSRSVAGALTDIGCIGGDGSDGCPPPAEESMDDPQGLAVSPDGKNVYVTTDNNNAVTVFTRQTNGSLSDVGCLATGGVHSCFNPGNKSLSEGSDITVSPDGASVYVVGVNTVTRLARKPNGGLTFAHCFSDGGSNGCAAAPHSSLAENFTVALTADGASTYVGSATSNSLTGFSTTLSPPNTGILKLHKHGHTVAITQVASEPLSSFKCRIDHKAYKSCAAKHVFKHVKKGKHTVSSKAINSQGTADPTPATRKVKIKH